MKADNYEKIIRIFISSPGDVTDERDKAKVVINGLKSRYDDQVSLKPLLWEDFALTADKPFQPGIDDVLSNERGIDIAVFILWSRLGSAVGEAIKKKDGTPYRSGTERELDLMLQARKQSEKDNINLSSAARPAILVYTRKDDDAFDEKLKGKNDQDKLDIINQRGLVKQFILEEFHDANGHNLRAYHTYQKLPDFSGRLRVHLIELLDELLDHRGAPWEKEPYVGLQAFQFEQSPIFKGREKEVWELAELLRARSNGGCAFVLVVGPSGSGKSSLVRAGLIPSLYSHEVEGTVSQWRRAILRPSEHDGNLLLALVLRLSDAENGIPELQNAATYGLEQLSVDLSLNPDITVRNVIARAISDMSKATNGSVRLVLLVDQLEELFTNPDINPVQQEQFLKALEALARSGHAWVVATISSDYYTQIQQSEILNRVLKSNGSMNLSPVDESVLRRIIVSPAKSAGLRFENVTENEKTRLEDRIFDEARPELLPHLQYLLRELYEARTSDNLLTNAAYNAMGGIKGVLGHRAETVFSELDAGTRAAFDSLMRSLVTFQKERTQTATRRIVLLGQVQDSLPKKQLVDALLKSRFLTTDKSPSGAPTVFLTHDILLSSWQRLSKWIEENRGFFEIRSEVENALQKWADSGKMPDYLLPEGLQLEEARNIIQKFPEQIGDKEKDFVNVSATAVNKRRQKGKKRLLIILFIISILCVVSIIAAFIARHQHIVAYENERKAKQTLSQSDYLQGIVKIENNDISSGLAYLASAIRNHPDQQHPAAAARIANLLIQRSFSLPLTEPLKHSGCVNSAVFSPDASKIVTASADKTAVIWDTGTGKPLVEPLQHREEVNSAVFSPDGTKIVTTSEDKTVRVWDATTGKPLTEPMQQDSVVNQAVFNLNGGRILTGFNLISLMSKRDDFEKIKISSMNEESQEFHPSVCLLDAITGKLLTLFGGKEEEFFNPAAFSPDGTKIVITSFKRGLQIMEVGTGKLLGECPEPAQLVVFRPDGNAILTVDHKADSPSLSQVESGYKSAPPSWCARIWDVTSGMPLTKPMEHPDFVLTVAFNPDGSKVVTTSIDKICRVWNSTTGDLLKRLIGHQNIVTSAVFSPDGSKIITASEDKTARVWDATTGDPLGEPLQHLGIVNSASFSPDGNMIITASKDQTARVWVTSESKFAPKALDHGGQVVSVSFSTDSSKVVTVSDNEAYLWDVSSGNQLIKPLQHEDDVISADISSDDSKIVTTSNDGTVRIWSAANGKFLAEPLPCAEFSDFETFSMDKNRTVTVQNKTVLSKRVAKYRKGKSWRAWKNQKDCINSATFSPDGSKILTASEDGTVRLWDSVNGQLLSEPMTHEKVVSSAVFSPNGNKILTASEDKTAKVWEATTGRLLTIPMEHGDYVNLAVFSPDGSKIVTASKDNTARVWDAATGKSLSEPLRNGDNVELAAFSPDGRAIVTISNIRGFLERGIVRIWETATGKLLTESMQHDGFINSVAFCPDGTKIVTASWDNTARVWDVTTGKPLIKPVQHAHIVNSAIFSPDGEKIITTSWDNTARVWEAATGKPLTEPIRHESGVNSAVFSPDGGKIVTASWDKTARVWDAVTGKPLTEPMYHEDNVFLAIFSPDGSKLLTASEDAVTRVWDTVTGKLLTIPLSHEFENLKALIRQKDIEPYDKADIEDICVSDLSVPHQGKNCSQYDMEKALAKMKKGAALWEKSSVLAAQEKLNRLSDQFSREFSGHKDEWSKAEGLIEVVFSPDGSKVMTTASNETARVWEVATGKPLTPYLEQKNHDTPAFFSPDGKKIVTTSWNNRSRIRDATSGQPLSERMAANDGWIWLKHYD